MATETPRTAAAGPPRISIALSAAALIALTVLLYLPEQTRGLLQLEHSSADLRTALFSHQIVGTHPRVAVVTITDASLPTTPIDRGFLADLVRATDAAGAHAIGLDIFFRRPTDPAKDQALQDALRTAKAKVVLAAWDERGLTDPAQQAYQRNFIAATNRPAGFVNFQEQDADGMVRYAAPPHRGSRYTESFALQLARTAAPSIEPSYGRIAWLRQVESSNPLGWLVNFEGTSPFIERTAVEMLSGDELGNRASLAGKIVLIGADLELQDQWRIPLTAWTKRPTAGVLIHAQQIAQYIDGRSVIELEPRTARLVLLGLALAGGLAGWRFRNRRFDFLSWGIATVMLIVLDAILFKTFHIILPFLMSLLAWFCGVTAGHHLGFIQDWVLTSRKVPG